MSDGEPLDAGAATWSVQLPQFEGPLDLLLHLCQKHELNVLDIPIGLVTEKYLEFLAVMELMELDVAAEYLVMAATLAHIKSKMLLPAPPPCQEDELAPEEEIDPREALIKRLLEYQKYKEAGEQLAARGVAGRDVFGRGMPLEEAERHGLAPLAEVPIFALVEAFQRVLDKSKVKLSHDIVADRLSLSDRIGQLSDLLAVRRRLRFEELFEAVSTKFDLVITFLALLEMTKLRMTRLFQTEPLGPLYVELAASDAERADGGSGPPDEAAPMTGPPDEGEPTPPDEGEPTPRDEGEPRRRLRKTTILRQSATRRRLRKTTILRQSATRRRLRKLQRARTNQRDAQEEPEEEERAAARERAADAAGHEGRGGVRGAAFGGDPRGRPGDRWKRWKARHGPSAMNRGAEGPESSDAAGGAHPADLDPAPETARGAEAAGAQEPATKAENADGVQDAAAENADDPQGTAVENAGDAPDMADGANEADEDGDDPDAAADLAVPDGRRGAEGEIEQARALSDAHLRGLLESLVFAGDKPLKSNELARLASAPVRQVKAAMAELKAEYSTRGIVLDEVAGGWLFRTNAQYAPFVRELAGGRPVKLSRAQLETLAIAAYRQPITRPEIDEIRGVDSGATLKLLLERDLVRILGKKDEPGRPLLYGTTTHFLEFFNMKSLRDLPTLREFTELSDESRKVAEAELESVLPSEPLRAPRAPDPFVPSAAPAVSDPSPDSQADFEAQGEFAEPAEPEPPGEFEAQGDGLPGDDLVEDEDSARDTIGPPAVDEP